MKKIFKFLYYSLFILFLLFAFSSCAKADSLNISDFDTETFTSSSNAQQRTCNEQRQVQSGTANVSFTCTINFNNTEWTNNFTKDNYNFLLYPINHSAYSFYNNDEEISDGISQTLVSHTYIVDYTLKMYLLDVNNKIYNCDIINNYIGACRYDRNVQIKSMSVELVFFTVKSVQQANHQIGSSLYYQSQYYLTSYSSMNKAITQVNNNITNSTINFDNDENGASTKINNFSSMIPTNGSVSQLLTLPINLASAFSSGLSSTCSQFNLGELFGIQIILPCISLQNLLGSTVWVVIDILIGGFMIYAMGKKIVRVFNDITSLKDNQIDDLYGGGA